MKWLVRFAKILVALVLVAVIGVPLALLGLANSETGTRWLIGISQQLATKADVSLEIDGVSGSLLHELRLSGVHLEAAGAEVAADRFVLRWQPRALLDRRLHIELLNVAGLQVRPPPPTDAPPTKPAIPDLALPLEIVVDRLAIDDLAIRQENSDVRFKLIETAIRLQAADWSLSGLTVDAEQVEVKGQLSMAPSAPHTVSAQITAGGRLPDLGNLRAELVLSGPALLPDIRLRIIEPTPITVDGSLDLNEIEPAFDLSASWPLVAWPLQGAAEFESLEGRIDVKGRTSDYVVQLTTRARGAQIPPASISLQGEGNAEQLRLEPLRIGALEGQAEITGLVGWSPAVHWDLQVDLAQINPGARYPDWPGRIAGSLTSSGEIREELPIVSANIAELGGTLRNQPLKASGLLQYDGAVLSVKQLDLVSGANRVRVDGSAGEVLDLAFSIDAPQLAQLYPGLAGKLNGQGKIGGRPSVPQVVSRLKGRQLGFEQLRVDALELDVDWDGQGGHAKLEVSDLIDGELVMSRITAGLDGRLESHKVAVSAAGNALDLTLAAQGGLEQDTWQGKLTTLRLQQPQAGTWQAERAAALQLGPERAQIDELCLVQRATSVCVDGGWQAAAGLDLRGRLRDLDLEQWAELIPGEAVLTGKLAAQFEVTGPPANPTARFEIRPGNGILRVPTDEEAFELTYSDVRIDGSFADDRGEVALNLQLAQDGAAQGAFTVGPGPQRALGGRMTARFPDLRLVSGFVPALDAVTGELTLDVGLGGSVASPKVDGQIRVIDASARIPAAGLQLADINLQVRGDGTGPLTLDGGLKSGEGRLAISGSVDPARPGGPYVDIAVTGDRFRAAQLPEADVALSPDLKIEGNAPYRLSGRLLIPQAKITINEVPASAVSVSDDEILVGEGAEPAQAPAPDNLTADVRVVLGDKVTFSGFGLKTTLVGAVDAVVDRRGTLLDGKIELKDAAYQAYGQDLTVEQGRLIFAGPPGNPDLDLRAVRESRDGTVKAYLAMSGPLAKPQPRIYSEPTLPEAEALAYLLTGRGLNQAGEQEGFDIASAALTMGLSKSEPLLQNLGNRLGLDEIKVESGDDGLQGSSLLLGKYLNPNLYLGYSQGLFDPQGSVLLRLKLSEHLEVESRAGEEQAVDLYYRLEHD